jgi:UPF0755 protein
MMPAAKPRPERKRKRGGRRAALLLLLLLTAAAAVLYQDLELPLQLEGAPAVEFTVPPGAGVLEIGRRLHEQGLVRHPLIFKGLVHWRGVGNRLRAGEYVFEGGFTLEDVVDKLVRGDVVRHTLTFPEGKNLEEMATLTASRGLGRAAFLKAALDPAPIRDLDPDAPDLEGYLFPDTYDLPREDGAAEVLVGRMLKRFREVIGPELPLLKSKGLTLREVVTLASLVELETGRAEERPRIAAVFHNRLMKKMPLQTDPTVIYALRKAGTWDGNIHKADLQIDSPYNTYRRGGLPPGPIAAPGREALLAVLHPAPVDDLYFVSRNDGTHQFSVTLAEHERAVDRYQRHRSSGSK